MVFKDGRSGPPRPPPPLLSANSLCLLSWKKNLGSSQLDSAGFCGRETHIRDAAFYRSISPLQLLLRGLF